MTDPASEPPDEPMVVIVPTAAAWSDVIERLEALEGVQPAEVPEDDDVHARLDRHRAELESIKRAFNALVEYVTAGPLQQTLTEPPQQLQPAPTTTTGESYL